MLANIIISTDITLPCSLYALRVTMATDDQFRMDTSTHECHWCRMIETNSGLITKISRSFSSVFPISSFFLSFFYFILHFRFPFTNYFLFLPYFSISLLHFLFLFPFPVTFLFSSFFLSRLCFFFCICPLAYLPISF